MCGRFTSHTSPDELAQFFAVDEIVAPDLGERYNVAPTDDIYAIANSGDTRRLGTFRWGLRSARSSRPLINARAETLADKALFRGLLERRRCVIPADGFFEWQHTGALPPWTPEGAERSPSATVPPSLNSKLCFELAGA